MPKDTQLIQISIEAADCPVKIKEINDYLDREDYDRKPDSLEFFFCANKDRKNLWAWKYLDRKNEFNYVVVVQTQPQERLDAYEICCGPCTTSNESVADALDTFASAGLW